MDFYRILRATCAIGALASSLTATAQSPGINAYRTSPAPPQTPLYASTLPAHALFPHDSLSRVREQMAQGHYRLARETLARQIRSSSETHYLAAIISANLGQYEDTARFFEASLAADKHHVGARVGAALLAIRLGRYDAAEDALRIIEARRIDCQDGCRDAAELDRGAEVIRHFLRTRSG